MQNKHISNKLTMQQLQATLREHGIYMKDIWVEALVKHLWPTQHADLQKQTHTFIMPSCQTPEQRHKLCASILPFAILADLTRTGAPALPQTLHQTIPMPQPQPQIIGGDPAASVAAATNNVTHSNSGNTKNSQQQQRQQPRILTGLFLLQVVAVRDISRPTVRTDIKHRGMEQEQARQQHSSYGRRVLQITLTDGTQTVKAIEKKECRTLPDPDKYKWVGAKVLLRNVPHSMSVLFLEPSNIRFLGGSVVSEAFRLRKQRQWKMQRQQKERRQNHEKNAPPPTLSSSSSLVVGHGDHRPQRAPGRMDEPFGPGVVGETSTSLAIGTASRTAAISSGRDGVNALSRSSIATENNQAQLHHQQSLHGGHTAVWSVPIMSTFPEAHAAASPSVAQKAMYKSPFYTLAQLKRKKRSISAGFSPPRTVWTIRAFASGTFSFEYNNDDWELVVGVDDCTAQTLAYLDGRLVCELAGGCSVATYKSMVESDKLQVESRIECALSQLEGLMEISCAESTVWLCGREWDHLCATSDPPSVDLPVIMSVHAPLSVSDGKALADRLELVV